MDKRLHYYANISKYDVGMLFFVDESGIDQKSFYRRYVLGTKRKENRNDK